MSQNSIHTTSPISLLQKQELLLRMEYEYEKETFRQQTETMGIGRKIKRGMCWYPLSVGRSYYNSLNQLVVEVERREDKEIEHVFEFGRPVCFFTQDASEKLHYFNFVATVNYVDEDRMVVVIPGASALMDIQNADRLGVQLYFDESTYRLMFEALGQVIKAKNNRLAELRDIFHGTLKTSTFTFAPTRFPWLNPTQEEAVNKVLHAKDVAIVHGPPGTGKTTTLVEAIYETLHRENQVLVCAQSNMAVDWISEKLVDRGVPVLRIGNPTRVNDKMLSFTYERRFESHPDYPQLWSIRKAIRDLHSQNRKGANRESIRQKINSLKDRATELEIRINADLFGEARVIACTLASSAHRVLMGTKFGTLFIDEAAQALEAACWIAIRKADRVVLAGDHQQLPPTIKCHEAMRGGLDKTLMQTICENKPRCVSMLTIQYRMSDEIMQFPNREFYDGLLHSDPSVKYRGILDWDTAIEWIESEEPIESLESPKNLDRLDRPEPPESPGELLASDGLSRINPAEARQALQALRNYIERIGRDRILHERLDIGIISPYKGQVQLLRRMLRRDSWWKPLRHLISVNTVDGFQGQERDIILISMVRNNEQGQVGFLSDLRRMNVAITRARMKLIIIGHSPTLCRHPFYKRLKHYIDNITEY